MDRRINQKDNLPPAFEIHKYDEVANFTAIDWWFAIKMRINLLNTIKEPFFYKEDKEDKEEKTIDKKVFELAFDQLLNNPLESDFYVKFEDDTFIFFDQGRYTIINDDYGLAVNHFPDEMIVPVENLPKFIRDEPRRLNENDFLTIKSPELTHKAECPFVVNISYPDKIILEQFKYFLRKAREEQGFKSIRTIDDYDLLRWVDYKFLAYIDLKLWCFFWGANITNKEFLKILCLNNRYDEDTIRKTIEPLRQELMDGLTYEDGGEDKDGLAKINQLKNLAYKKQENMLGVITHELKSEYPYNMIEPKIQEERKARQLKQQVIDTFMSIRKNQGK